MAPQRRCHFVVPGRVAAKTGSAKTRLRLRQFALLYPFSRRLFRQRRMRRHTSAASPHSPITFSEYARTRQQGWQGRLHIDEPRQNTRAAVPGLVPVPARIRRCRRNGCRDGKRKNSPCGLKQFALLYPSRQPFLREPRSGSVAAGWHRYQPRHGRAPASKEHKATDEFVNAARKEKPKPQSVKNVPGLRQIDVLLRHHDNTGTDERRHLLPFNHLDHGGDTSRPHRM
jgi:hypothetical protein